MDNRDARALFDLLESAWIAKGRQPEQVTEKVLDVWIRLLADVPLRYVERALEIHGRDATAKHPPTPADVLQIIDERTGPQWPEANEAWAIALASMDEHASVVWCAEIAQARSAALPIMAEGDEVGARMAFLESYRGLVERAKREHRRIEWIASPGHDVEGREALRLAVERGQIKADRVERYLPASEPDSGFVAGLLASAAESNPESWLGQLRELKAELLRPEPDEVSPERAAEIERRRAAAKAMLGNKTQH
jgi:hypothetical protein